MSLFNSLISPFNRTAAPATGAVDSVPTVRPRYEVKETTDAYGVVVHLPGVAREGLEITAEDDVIRIVGRRGWKRPDDWTQLYRESTDAAYELVLGHDHAVDLEKIHAELKDGVLRVSLPKAESIKPRKIAVA